MRNIFLSSSGLNDKTAKLFWKCIDKEPKNTKVIFVPSAAVENDGAREGIIICMERHIQAMSTTYPHRFV